MKSLLPLVCVLGVIFTTNATTSKFDQFKSSLKETLWLLENLESEKDNEIDCSQCSAVSKPSSCAEVLLQGNSKSGIYTIYPKPWLSKLPVKVYCDMDTDGGGWTVIQRRTDVEKHENFYRGWEDYRTGFGLLDKEFWLGNEHIYALTNQEYVSFRVDLEDFEGRTRHALYKEFRVAGKRENFAVTSEKYTGDAGDNMNFKGVSFVTFDFGDVNDCSKVYKGGWWYQKCHQANLNGLYLKGNHSSFANGVNWLAFKGYHYSLKKSEMKIRPRLFLDDCA